MEGVMMTGNSFFRGALASLFEHIFAALLGNSPQTPVRHQYIRCHGTHYPMTARVRKQSLPLQGIRHSRMRPGRRVLSDADGYTVNNRTADGRWLRRAHVLTPTVRKQAKVSAPG